MHDSTANREGLVGLEKALFDREGKRMECLRPNQVFAGVEETERLAVVCLPLRHSLTSMLERAILASLLKLVKPRNVFEFGTYLGESALILAANTDASIYSIDLDENRLQGALTKFDEFELANVKRRFSDGLVFQGTQYEHRIKTLIGDSTIYDFSPFYQQIDFVLIDGGHHIDVVESDTHQAFKMLSADHPACIVWHDYGNPNYEITGYLDDLSHQFELYRVAETSYVFFMNNAGKDFSANE